MAFLKSKLNRRELMRRGATVAAAGVTAPALAASVHASEHDGLGFHSPHAGTVEETSIAELQAMMESGALTARQLVGMYIDRIHALDWNGPQLRSMLEINPDALAIATRLDQERAEGNVRGPLHGIPIALKDNIDTADSMETTAGSLALLGSKPMQDATVAAKLRDAGAILLGKAGLSEWANFRSSYSSSGWSGRGGQVRNPYIIDRNPCGSSSGSGTAPSASLTAAAIGTETDGSIVCPSSATGVVGIKPSVGLTSRAGVIPISHTQDTIGPMARTVADAATVLTAIVGADDRDPVTSEAQNVSDDYTQFLDADGLNGARIGIARELFGFSPEADWVMGRAINAMRDAGAVLVDPVSLPNPDNLDFGTAEFEVLLYEFGPDLAAYLEGRTSGSPRTLEEIIEFNRQNAEIELRWFGQDIFLSAAAKGPLSEAAYLEALETSFEGSRAQLDAALDGDELDAIIAPTGAPAWPTDLINGDHFIGGTSSAAARAGYPLVSVPAGYAYGLPVGITFMGRLWDEATLIKLASGFEAVTQARRTPRFQRTFMP